MKRLRKNQNDKLVLIDGDQVRNLYENNLGYDPISRSKNTYRYINLVKWLMEHDISSIVAVISPFQKDRDVCRKEIKNYKEIYLSCSLEERIRRDKKKLYIPALEGKKNMWQMSTYLSIHQKKTNFQLKNMSKNLI